MSNVVVSDCFGIFISITTLFQYEGVDSDEDGSSESSHDSDLSGKRGQLSASTLSVKEVGHLQPSA